MEKILAVYGESNTGKTTVINEIYNVLLQKGAIVKVSKRKIGENPYDFYGVLEYNKKTVSFLSMGDCRTIVDEFVTKYKRYDIFITALNKHFSCIGTVWLKNSDIICKFDKTSPTNADNLIVKKNVLSKI